MVSIAAPPPANAPSPILLTLPQTSEIMRIYDPAKHGMHALSFRNFGPLHRFDHHRHPASAPDVDNDRAILYGGFTLSCCIVEVFGDTGIIEPGTKWAAILSLQRPLNLLDLRGTGAMRAGTVAAVSKEADRNVTQAWARYFYDNEGIYGTIDGLIFFNAHNDEEAVALFERAENALLLPPGNTIELGDPAMRTELQHIAIRNNLLVPPS